ncbi:hypothetical protein V6N11_003221 [Hibiscus sabdariffa]|uniref:Uncharacterized protein n=1 Tax=Hibiscus sabdariffa TaxID=183260 RepID=A0ABR2SD14_9ROSI
MVVLLVRTDIGFFSGSHKEEGGVIFRRLHCREGFCFDNGVDQFLVAKRIISYGRNEGELSVEELFLFWRSERFRKYKIRSSRSFLSSLLVAQRCLPRSDFTSIASFLSLFWKKVQVLISGRQGYEGPLLSFAWGYPRVSRCQEFGSVCHLKGPTFFMPSTLCCFASACIPNLLCPRFSSATLDHRSSRPTPVMAILCGMEPFRLFVDLSLGFVLLICKHPCPTQ